MESGERRMGFQGARLLAECPSPAQSPEDHLFSVGSIIHDFPRIDEDSFPLVAIPSPRLCGEQHDKYEFPLVLLLSGLAFQDNSIEGRRIEKL